jgi:hypothetical protein
MEDFLQIASVKRKGGALRKNARALAQRRKRAQEIAEDGGDA